jgi:hypothetical protein
MSIIKKIKMSIMKKIKMSIMKKIKMSIMKKIKMSIMKKIKMSIMREDSVDTICGAGKATRGRCYDHNFLRFSTIFGEKNGFFSKTNVIIKILQKLAVV